MRAFIVGNVAQPSVTLGVRLFRIQGRRIVSSLLRQRKGDVGQRHGAGGADRRAPDQQRRSQIGQSFNLTRTPWRNGRAAHRHPAGVLAHRSLRLAGPSARSRWTGQHRLRRLGLAMMFLLLVTSLQRIGAMFTDARTWTGLIVGLGLFETGLAYVIYYFVVEHLGAVAAAGVTYIPPVVALVIGVFLVGDTTHPIGHAAMIGGRRDHEPPRLKRMLPDNRATYC